MFSRILLPHDGSLLAERALPFAVSLVRGTHGHLYLLSVASDLSVMAHPWTELDSVIRLNQLAEQLRDQGIAASCRTMHGDPASAILLEAQETQADLIVMSTHAQSRLGGWLCGSFADRVFCESAVPVLLVPGHVASSGRLTARQAARSAGRLDHIRGGPQTSP